MNSYPENETSCEVCGFSFKLQDKSRLHSHHVRPLSHGGDDDSLNRILLCPNCHSVAHILLQTALDGFGAVDIYKLYQRQHLTLAILKYQGDSPFRRYWRARMNLRHHLWNYKWLRIRLRRNKDKKEEETVRQANG